jgi:hypothetical protein
MTTTVTANMPATVNLHAYCGDSYTQLFRFLAGTDPIDLTNLNIRSTARASTGTRTDLAVSNMGDGFIQLAAPTGLAPDLYDYDIQITANDGNTATWVRGKLRLTEDVTQ